MPATPNALVAPLSAAISTVGRLDELDRCLPLLLACTTRHVETAVGQGDDAETRHVSYGRGIGVWCAMWLRQGVDGLPILADWIAFPPRLRGRALTSRRWHAMLEEIPVRVGTGRGMPCKLRA